MNDYLELLLIMDQKNTCDDVLELFFFIFWRF